jgi:hypothetical protein
MYSAGTSRKLNDVQYRTFMKIRFSRCPVNLRGKMKIKRIVFHVLVQFQVKVCACAIFNVKIKEISAANELLQQRKLTWNLIDLSLS